MLGRIWERYYFIEMIKVFCLFMASILGLYVLIDYSSHAQTFSKYDIEWVDLAQYYFFHFSKQWEILVPFAILLATIRTLSVANLNRELVALLASGVTRKRILVPILIGGLIGAASLAANFECLRPHATLGLKHLEDSFMDRKRGDGTVNGFSMTDGGTVVYQTYDSAKERFLDFYWLPSRDKLIRIRYLYPDKEQSIGEQVEIFERGKDETFSLKHSADYYLFPELQFDEEKLRKAMVDTEYMGLVALWKQLPKRKYKHLNDRETRLLTAFHKKLAFPLLCLLAVITPASFCMQFTRHMHLFVIFGVAILAYIVFLMVFNAMVVLGENQFVHPLIAIWSPFAICFLLFGRSWLYME